MSIAPAERLHLINSRLDTGVNRLRSALSTGLTPPDLAALHAEISEAREELRGMLPGSVVDRRLHDEVREYHHHLEQLRQLLPAVQLSLQRDRKRTKERLEHLQTVAAWAAANATYFK